MFQANYNLANEQYFRLTTSFVGNTQYIRTWNPSGPSVYTSGWHVVALTGTNC